MNSFEENKIEKRRELGLDQHRDSLHRDHIVVYAPIETDPLADRLDQKYDFTRLEKNQKLIIDMIREHDESVHGHLDESQLAVVETIRRLHCELQKSSLRSRLSVYTGSAILGSTLLMIVHIIYGDFVISSPVPTVLLVSSIAFWLLARFLPKLPDLSVKSDHAR